jgi:Tfp pilus assembly pilus retraction ATPase PilT
MYLMIHGAYLEGTIMIGQNLPFLGTQTCGKTVKNFLTEALDRSGTDAAEVNVPVRKVDPEAVHYNMWYATGSQSAVIYKVFGKIRELMEWEAGDQKPKFVPLRLMVRGAAGTGKIFIINTIVSYMICMFDDNDMVHVVEPMGMAASNVLGGHYIGLWVYIGGT